MEKLSGRKARYLRGLGHHLSPTVSLGQAGVSEALLRELEGALAARELVKVRVGRGCPADRAEVAEELAQRTGAAVAQIIGKTILLYRRGAEPQIELPDD
jgi:RNA-binding protein